MKVQTASGNTNRVTRSCGKDKSKSTPPWPEVVLHFASRLCPRGPPLPSSQHLPLQPLGNRGERSPPTSACSRSSSRQLLAYFLALLLPTPSSRGSNRGSAGRSRPAFTPGSAADRGPQGRTALQGGPCLLGGGWHPLPGGPRSLLGGPCPLGVGPRPLQGGLRLLREHYSRSLPLSPQSAPRCHSTALSFPRR